MKKHHFCCLVICLIIIPILFSSCQLMLHNSNKTDYITANGTIHYIKYNEDKSVLYLGLSNIDPFFDDNMFKIEGNYLQIAQKHHIDDMIKPGVEIEFVAHSEYLGDGFVYSIVHLLVNGITLF